MCFLKTNSEFLASPVVKTKIEYQYLILVVRIHFFVTYNSVRNRYNGVDNPQHFYLIQEHSKNVNSSVNRSYLWSKQQYLPPTPGYFLHALHYSGGGEILKFSIVHVSIRHNHFFFFFCQQSVIFRFLHPNKVILVNCIRYGKANY